MLKYAFRVPRTQTAADLVTPSLRRGDMDDFRRQLQEHPEMLGQMFDLNKDIVRFILELPQSEAFKLDAMRAAVEAGATVDIGDAKGMSPLDLVFSCAKSRTNELRARGCRDMDGDRELAYFSEMGRILSRGKRSHRRRKTEKEEQDLSSQVSQVVRAANGYNAGTGKQEKKVPRTSVDGKTLAVIKEAYNDCPGMGSIGLREYMRKKYGIEISSHTVLGALKALGLKVASPSTEQLVGCLNSGMSQAEVAEKFGISLPMVGIRVRKEGWMRVLDGKYIKPKAREDIVRVQETAPEEKAESYDEEAMELLKTALRNNGGAGILELYHLLGKNGMGMTSLEIRKSAGAIGFNIREPSKEEIAGARGMGIGDNEIEEMYGLEPGQAMKIMAKEAVRPTDGIGTPAGKGGVTEYNLGTDLDTAARIADACRKNQDLSAMQLMKKLEEDGIKVSFEEMHKVLGRYKISPRPVTDSELFYHKHREGDDYNRISTIYGIRRYVVQSRIRDEWHRRWKK